ncbi:MAG: NrfD/PsrC family molybdoenzyme membrane anchor subunit [Candidatus Kryptoniota bacterium]
MNRVKNTKVILWLVTGFAAAIAMNRFIFGLGATTNLNDEVPWGFWIGFKLSWVALSAGGFVIGAIFYMMKQQKFHTLVKIAILTAFLGYSSFIISLIFDLGLPWNIWHMIIYWNPHSPLFEVGWCVMLYTTVLILEFSPVPLEKYSRYAKIRNFLMRFRFPLVLLGIMLSTLHQSSLGTLFLVMQHRLYPLFYSHAIPIEFFISAIAGGLLMLVFEILALHWLYRRKLETDLVSKLCGLSVWFLSLYLIIKIGDVLISRKFELIFNGSWLSNLFIAEVLVSTVIPLVMFSVPKWRKNRVVEWVGSGIAILGVVLNRIDIGGFAMIGATSWYTPSWMEVVLSFGILCTAGLVFMFAIEKFNVWDERPEDPESFPHTPPSFDLPSYTWIGTSDVASITRYSLAFVISFAAGMAVMPGKRLYAEGIYNVKVKPATAVDNLADTLCINGNRDDQYVVFSHRKHISWISGHMSSLAGDSIVAVVRTAAAADSCVICHHLNLPGERLSSCWECHVNMYTSTDFFKHDWHASGNGANLKCVSCHKKGVTRDGRSAKDCTACHPAYRFSHINLRSSQKYLIPSYVDAMHKMCVSCHVIESRKIKEKPALGECSSCHRVGTPPDLSTSLKWDIKLPRFNNVVLPSVEVSKK